jgi:hypothetical protein
LLLVASFALYLTLALLIDSHAAPRGRFWRRPAWGHVVSIMALSLLFAAWFAPSFRPVFASGAALITLGIVVLISDYKYENVLEPLNFVDFTLVPQIWRHPLLYRADFLHHPVFFLVVAGVLAIIVGWCSFVEPSLLAAERHWMLAGVAVVSVVGGIAWAIVGPLPAALTSALHRRLVPVDSARHVSEIGLSGSLLAGLLGWRRPIMAARSSLPAPPAVSADAEAPVVIAVQSESFVDLRGAGLRDVRLPALEEARAQAVAHGRVKVPVQGAWTLRSEFVFLAGQPLEQFGLDALHPYLRLPAPPRTLAHELRDAGFATTFVHPYDLNFFNRRVAMPKLGFDRLLGDGDFADVRRDGYFVPDAALADRVLAMAANDPLPMFCMIATMENHNPWDKDRIPGIASPVDQYVHHLRNADRMIGQLVAGIEELRRPAVLAFYGDHVPTMPDLADPFPDPRTDYFVMGRRHGAWLAGERRDRALHELADVVLRTLAQVRGVEAR